MTRRAQTALTLTAAVVQVALVAMFAWVALSLPAQSAVPVTTLTGTIRDLTGAVVMGGRVQFTTTLVGSQDATIPGVGRFVPSTVYCRITSTGTLQNVAGTGACTITASTSLSPSGTSYAVCVQAYNVQPGGCFNFFAPGNQTVDISTIAPTPGTLPTNYGGIPGPAPYPAIITKTFTGRQTLTYDHNLGTFFPVCTPYYVSGVRAGAALVPLNTNQIAVTLPAAGVFTLSCLGTSTRTPAVITWATPAPLVTGSPLTSTQLNATSNVPGTFTYNPPSGTVFPNAGSQTLTASFAPTDFNQYGAATAAVTLSVILNPGVYSWAMNEGSGSTSAETVHGNTLTYTSGSWGTDSVLGNLASFSGSTSATTASATYAQFSNTAAFSFAAWIKPTSASTATQPLISTYAAGSSASPVGWAAYVSDNKFYVQFLANVGTGNYLICTSANQFTDGTLAHVGFAYNNGAATFYVNGAAIAMPCSGTITSTMANSATTLYIGSQASDIGATKFSGLLGRMHVFGTALGASDFQTLYNNHN